MSLVKWSLVLGLVAACGAAQDKSEAAYAAIVAGCKVSLDIDRDAGEAGAVDTEAKACDKTLKVWESHK